MNPGNHIPAPWLTHPGAAGCTEQACEFRDHHEYLKRTNTELFGVSNRNRTELLIARNHHSLPFELLSDEDFKCRNKFGLPTIIIDGKEYYSRLTMIIEKCVIKKIFYPVETPGMNVHDVIDFIQSQED
jgi:peroxiredoxin